MMTRYRVLRAVAGSTAVIVLVGAVVLWRLGGGDTELGGAEQWATGSESVYDSYAEAEDPTVEDLSIRFATNLFGDENGGFWMLSGGYVAHVSADGQDVVAFASSHRGAAQGIAVDGTRATLDSRRTEQTVYAMSIDRGEYGPPAEVGETRFPAQAVALDDDALLIGASESARIDRMNPGGTTRRLLGPPGDGEAQAHLAEPVSRIVRIVPLDDDRIVFVGDTPDGFQLFVLDGTEAWPVDVDDANPVAELDRGDIGYIEFNAWLDALPMEPIAPAPDGRLIATGLGPDGDPRISLVDVDTGEVEVLAELDGVEPGLSIDSPPISVVAVDDDVVFLAEGKLWRLEDVFAD